MALCIKLQHPLALAWAQKLCGSSFTAWVSMGEQLLLVAQCLCLYGVQLLLPISLVFVTVISISISVTCEHFWNCTEKRNARYAAYWKSLDACVHDIWLILSVKWKCWHDRHLSSQLWLQTETFTPRKNTQQLHVHRHERTLLTLIRQSQTWHAQWKLTIL